MVYDRFFRTFSKVDSQQIKIKKSLIKLLSFDKNVRPSPDNRTHTLLIYIFSLFFLLTHKNTASAKFYLSDENWFYSHGVAPGENFFLKLALNVEQKNK